jgi:hypothetical protein
VVYVTEDVSFTETSYISEAATTIEEAATTIILATVLYISTSDYTTLTETPTSTIDLTSTVISISTVDVTATEIQTSTVTAPLVATCSCSAPEIQNHNFDGYSNPLYDSTEDILPWTYPVLPPSTLSNYSVEVVPLAYGVEPYDGSSLLLVTMPQGGWIGFQQPVTLCNGEGLYFVCFSKSLTSQSFISYSEYLVYEKTNHKTQSRF